MPQHTPTTNAVRLLRRLLAAPHRDTRRQLAEYLGVSRPDTVTTYMDNLRAAGIQVEFDAHHRYYIVPEKGFRELEYLAPLSEGDKLKLKRALRHLGEAERLQLLNKLESLYDFQQLGIEALRAPELEKINDIEQAKRERRQVRLIGYRSRNSNDVRDRRVEAFAVEPERGMIRAYDVEADEKRTSFFMLSRMDRVELLDDPWQYEPQHHYREADAFNIVMDRREMVRMTLDVSAYNDLVERHPQARQYLRAGAQSGTWDFQGRVNEKFIGLISFVLANWQGVNVHGPDKLCQCLRSVSEKVHQKFGTC